jgi:GTPase SAR1 family protein
LPKIFTPPRYVTIDLFGKVEVGKTTIFELFAGDKFLKEGGNLSYDFRGYYAKCWVLPRRWNHTMVFLADPKLEFRWKDLRAKHLRKLFEPTNILMLVTDSTPEDVESIKNCFDIWPIIKRKLIIFLIANMQDRPNHLSVSEIKERLQMKDVIGTCAINYANKEKIEEFMEEAVMRYFKMLAKRGKAMMILDENEIGFGKKIKPKKEFKGKYTDRLQKIKQKRMKRQKKELNIKKKP